MTLKKSIFIKRNLRLYFCLFILSLFCIVISANADQSQFTKNLQKVLDSAVLSSKYTPGAVMLISSPKLGTIIVASGFADKITETPMLSANNFRLASISKTFLAVVILNLSEEKKLNLDDKIADLLPKEIDVDRIPNGKEVTVRQLLQMRSGIPNYIEYDGYTEMVKAKPSHRWVPKDGVEFIYDEKPNFEPGEDYEYSNTNYILLQSIVEEVTGSTLHEQFKKYIFEPLNLRNTYQEVEEVRSDGFNGLTTHGYELEDGKLIDVTTINDGLGLGDGGLVSTAQDLATFVQALLLSKTLLPQNKLDEMLTVAGPDKYGLGIYQEEVSDELAWTHNGTSNGFNGQYYYFPNRKLTIIILTNCFDSDIIDDLVVAALEVIDQQ